LNRGDCVDLQWDGYVEGGNRKVIELGRSAADAIDGKGEVEEHAQGKNRGTESKYVQVCGKVDVYCVGVDGG
jgi:hypothetical protein